MALIVLALGVAVAIAILATIPRVPTAGLRGATAAAAAIVLVASFALSSIRYVPSNEVGIVTKNLLGPSLKDGRVIAVNGEMGVQADVLRSGWHFWYWPIIFDVRTVEVTEIAAGEVGLLDTTDGVPLGAGQLFAPEWERETFQRMMDARFFLTEGQGRKGPQSIVLTPGKYPLNTQLFRVTKVPQTDVPAGKVAVLRSNFGAPASRSVEPPREVTTGDGAVIAVPNNNDVVMLAGEGEMGVRAAPLGPGKYPLNPSATAVVQVATSKTIVQYTAAHRAGPGTPPPQGEEREITVRTSDGFTFPVDVRVEYQIEAEHAPIVVARLGGDGDSLRNVLDSAVRAIFRNNAEKVKALDYVQDRSVQEQQSLTMLATEMAKVGVTVTAVRIGNVGDEASLGELLRTQTDREIAKQEQLTFQEQQKAAEQQKELTRTKQEAEEERRLATAAYAVKIAEEEKSRKLIEAQAEAESVKIKAGAQADAYQLIGQQIGKGNAALVELLKIIGEKNIQITPRVMVTTGGGNGAGGALAAGETTALIGTMLDSMMSREDGQATAPGQPAVRPPAQPGSPALPGSLGQPGPVLIPSSGAGTSRSGPEAVITRPGSGSR